ncbi:MAG: hypothetical protein L0H15_04780 [Nitrosospira sp.]|nr:hypothetical protein [Nitrosospira sp.]
MIGMVLSSGSDTTVKRHIGRLFRETGWTDAGQGWEGKDGELSLMGWQKRRRVVVLRRPLMGEIMITEEEDGQQLLAFVEADRKAGKGILEVLKDNRKGQYSIRVNDQWRIASSGRMAMFMM